MGSGNAILSAQTERGAIMVYSRDWNEVLAPQFDIRDTLEDFRLARVDGQNLPAYPENLVIEVTTRPGFTYEVELDI